MNILEASQFAGLFYNTRERVIFLIISELG